MRLAQRALVTWLTAAAAIAGCNRAEPIGDDRDISEAGAAERQNETAALERRLDALQSKWKRVQSGVADRTEPAVTAMKGEIQDSLDATRDTLAELRTTTAHNWWEREERELERAAAKVEQNVRRFTQRWNPPNEAAAATSDENVDWRARRDALLSRLERRVRAMETALNDLDPRELDRADVRLTRSQIEHLKGDMERVRNASEAEWWKVTTERVNGSLAWLETTLDQLSQGRPPSSGGHGTSTGLHRSHDVTRQSGSV